MTRNEAIAALAPIHKAQKAAWNKMMNGSDIDARTVYGEEGKNYIEWCKAADAERAFREEHELCDYPNKRRSN